MIRSVLNLASQKNHTHGKLIVVPVIEPLRDMDELIMRYEHYGVTKETFINHALILVTNCFNAMYWERDPVMKWYFEDVIVGEFLTSTNFNSLSPNGQRAVSHIARTAGREIATVVLAVYAVMEYIFKPLVERGELCYTQLRLVQWIGRDILIEAF